MKSAAIALTVFVASASALAACRQTDERAATSPASRTETAAASEADAALAREAQDMRDSQRRELEARRARAAADPVLGVIERADVCLHFGGEEAYDEERRAQINQAFEDNTCDTVVSDGDALKAERPQDAARLEAAIADLRP